MFSSPAAPIIQNRDASAPSSWMGIPTIAPEKGSRMKTLGIASYMASFMINVKLIMLARMMNGVS